MTTMTREFLTRVATEHADCSARISPRDVDVLRDHEKRCMTFCGMPLIADSSVPRQCVVVVDRDGNARRVPWTTTLDELAEAVCGDD